MSTVIQARRRPRLHQSVSVACRTTRSTLLRPVTPSAARRARSPPRSRGGVRARLGHARLPAGRTLDDGVLLRQRSGPGGRELQLEADELAQAHPRAARELEPVAEEERACVADDLPGQEPVHLALRGLTGGHDLEQTALVGDASDLPSVTEHGRIVVGRDVPHFHDLADSGGVTTTVVERAIGSHGDPPVEDTDLVATDGEWTRPVGRVAGTEAPLPAIEMVNASAEKPCRNPEHGHCCLP